MKKKQVLLNRQAEQDPYCTEGTDMSSSLSHSVIRLQQQTHTTLLRHNISCILPFTHLLQFESICSCKHMYSSCQGEELHVKNSIQRANECLAGSVIWCTKQSLLFTLFMCE